MKHLKYKIKNIIILAIILLYSCSSSKNEWNTYSIDELIDTDKSIGFSDLNADVQRVNLETTPESFFVTADKVIYTNDYIYILASEPNKILQFKIDGKFIRQLSAYGKSGNEYLFANDIFIDSQENRLFINDMGGGKVLEYDLDGVFIKSRKIESYISKNYLIDNDCFFESFQVILGNEPYKLIVKNRLGDTLSLHLNNMKHKLSNNTVGFADKKSLFKLNDEIIYHQMWSDTIYTYNYANKSLDVRYLFKNKKPLTADDLEQLYDRILQLILIFDIAEDDHYIYVTIMHQNLNKHLYLIDKNSGVFYKADFIIKKSSNPRVADLVFFPKWQNGTSLIDCVQLDEESNPTIILIKPKLK